jgi:hypothetical protein
MAYRRAELEVEIDPDAEDPLDSLSDSKLDDVFEAVVRADPLMSLVDDEETVGAYTVEFQDLSSGETFSRDLMERPWINRFNASEIKSESTNPELTLSETLSELAANPVFAMSLGSKELFHSNFLAWILEWRRQNFLPRLLQEVGVKAATAESGQVWREWQSFDLAVQIGPGDLLVIENKFKSLPRSDQLSEYAEKARNACKDITPHLILLSPTSPVTWMGGAGTMAANVGWTHLSYDKLVDILREVAHLESDNFVKELIGKYSDMVVRLLTLREQCSAKVLAPFIPGPNYEELKRGRIHDLIYKWRFDELAETVETLLGTDLYRGTGKDFLDSENPQKGILVGTGFTNGSALVELFTQAEKFRKDAIPDSVPLVGVQFQDNKLRLVLRNVPRDQAKDFLQSTAVGEILSGLQSSIKVRPRTRAEKEVNKYGDSFFYRYAAIEEISLDRLAQVITDVCKSLADLCAGS